MGYSARRGFTNGSMKMTGAQRQAEMQARIQQMQEQVNAAQEAVEAQESTAKRKCWPLPSNRRPWTRRMWRCSRTWWYPL